MVFGKESIIRCSSAEGIPRNGCVLEWFHRGVGRQTEETVGFPEWTAQLLVWKTTVKDSSEARAIVCQNCAFYSVFPSGMTSSSKIVQFNCECIARFKQTLFIFSGLMLSGFRCSTGRQRHAVRTCQRARIARLSAAKGDKLRTSGVLA